MNDRPQRISISLAVDSAWAGMVAQLFKPFDLGHWFALGFSAWLSIVGQGGFQLNLGENSITAENWQGLREFWELHAVLIASFAVLAILFLIALALVLLWLRCRGTFMFLRNIVRGEALVAEPWRAAAGFAGSLFRGSLVLGLIAIVAIVAGTIPLALAAHSAAQSQGTWAGMIGSAAVVALVGLVVVVSLISFFAFIVQAIAVPAMFLRGIAFWPACGAAFRLLGQRPGAIILYGLVKLLLSFAAVIVLLLLGVLTCCCGLFLMALPYVGAVVMLPYYVFFRLCDLHILKQVGPEWDAWHVASPPPLPADADGMEPTAPA